VPAPGASPSYPMTLYLPPAVAAERRREFAAEIDKRCDPNDPLAQRFTRELQQIDSRLMMVRARPLIATGTPLIPGYYHVLRVNDEAPLSVFAVHENGRYCEPDSRVFERLAAGDLHDPRTLRRWAQAERDEQRAAERDQEREHEERREELRDRVNAATRTWVSMNRDEAWSQNVKGRRR
jgi:hypothetical protein